MSASGPSGPLVYQRILQRNYIIIIIFSFYNTVGAQWLSGRVLDSRLRGSGFEPHHRHCVVSLNKNNNPSLVLVHSGRSVPL